MAIKTKKGPKLLKKKEILSGDKRISGLFIRMADGEYTTKLIQWNSLHEAVFAIEGFDGKEIARAKISIEVLVRSISGGYADTAELVKVTPIVNGRTTESVLVSPIAWAVHAIMVR